ncbi:hypothetical protein CQA53_08870 [Helicobacter didelphidarum]|uniref:Uncharacterized protein n=1 Tax=Helicobacter didelphidarum TaxID=2040648 RepID=A0A3D8ICP8_9HELI|nr:hypothetical protein [Helicobacter didelphidarum]RDU62922.1 hypothetical protein CQA53_08870 [Helicobacter didelphidarum]
MLQEESVLYSHTFINEKKIIFHKEKHANANTTSTIHSLVGLVAKALQINPNTLAQRKFQNTIPYNQVLDFLHSKNISINQFFYGSSLEERHKSSSKYKILKLYKTKLS